VADPGADTAMCYFDVSIISPLTDEIIYIKPQKWLPQVVQAVMMT
jgi:hypothetical protein